MNKTTVINYQPGGRDVVFKFNEVKTSLVLTTEQVNQQMLDQQNTAELVAIGPDVIGYEVGDKVLLRSARWTSIAIDDKEYGQISVGEILGKTLNDASTKLTEAMKEREYNSNLATNTGVIGSNHSKHVK